MSDPAFDTLGAARKLKTVGIEAEQADAIVEVMRESANQLVTEEQLDAGLAKLLAQIEGLSNRIDSVNTELQAQIEGLSGRIDTLRIEMRAYIMRSQLIMVTIVIAANALMMTVMGISLNQGAIL